MLPRLYFVKSLTQHKTFTMSDGHILVFIGGLIIGLVMAIISLIVTEKKLKNKPYGHSSKGSTGNEDYTELKQELARLQNQIDEINRERRIKSKGCSTIDSSYDYKSACEELDLNDFDLLNAWGGTDFGPYDNCIEVSKYQEKLNAVDKNLENEDKYNLRKVLDQLEDLCYDNPEDVELLFRIGKTHAKLSLGESNDVVMMHANKGIEALTSALQLNDKHADVHKWYAILLGLRAEFQPMKQKVTDGFLFKKHCDLAFALNPKDCHLHYLLGRFDYEIASLGWFERKAATTIAKSVFDVSFESTYSDALNKFITAEKLAVRQNITLKERKENLKMIGKTHIALKNTEEAVQWLTKAKKLGSVDAALDQEVDNLLQKHQ